MNAQDLVMSLRKLLQYRIRVIVDINRKVGRNSPNGISYNCSLNKEQICRDFVFNQAGNNLRFLDVGARDGKLSYLLGISKNLSFNKKLYSTNRERFYSKYQYWGLDIEPNETDNVLVGDICSDAIA